MTKDTTISTSSGSRRWWALGALTLCVLAVSLDGTVLSVALPTLAGALHASESDLQWFTSGYLLVLAAAMLPVGLLGDRFGRKSVLLICLAIFGAGSAACALATTPAEFIAARAVLGIGGAGVIVMALSALTVMFTPQERPRAVGVWSAANFLALPAGPVLGGWLLTHYWWGWVFLINVPVALLGLTAGALLVSESRAAARPGLDPIGLALAAAGLTLVTYGLIDAGESGWADPATWSWLVAGAVLIVAFGAVERRLGRRPGGEPLIDPKLFRSRSYTVGVVLAAVGVLAMVGVLFTVPQYFQGVQGDSALVSGLRLLPLIGGLIVGAVPADRVSARLGRKATLTAGFAALAAGLALGAATEVTSSAGSVAAWMALAGFGLGVVVATATSAALSELDAERSGVGSAVFQAVNKTGAPFGAAILGSVLLAIYRSRLDNALIPSGAANAVRASIFGGTSVAETARSTELLDSVRAAFTAGMDASLWVCAAIAAAGAIGALGFVPGRRADPNPSYSTREHTGV